MREFSELLHARGVERPLIPSASTSEVTALIGYRRWRAMMHMFATQKFLITLSYQTRFRTAMMETLLPIIYHENGEWGKYRDLICAHHLGTRPYVPYSAMICARQVGKSTIVANTLLALVLHVPNQEIMVISIGARQSVELGNGMLSQMEMALGAGAAAFITRKTKELIEFKNGTSVFLAPATPQGVRGVHIACLIADEACFMKDRDAFATVLPFMSFDSLPMVFLSSPNPEENFVKRLIEYRDIVTGAVKCNAVRVRQVCSACSRMDLIQCAHVEGADPPWKSNTQDLQFLSSIYTGTMGGYELGGMDDSTKRPAFNPVTVASLRDSPTYKLVQVPEAAMIAIDPCGGGAQSDCAIVLSLVMRDLPGSETPNKVRIVVLGWASVRLTTGTNDTMFNVIRALLTRVRQIPLLRKTRIAVVIEGNLSYLGAMDLAGRISSIGDPNIITMSETKYDKNKRPVMGPYVYLDGNRGKERYVMMMDAMMRTGTIVFSDQLVVQPNRENFTPADYEQAQARFRTKLVDQLYNFNVQVTPRADGSSVKTFSGKGSGSDGKDDLAMAMMMTAWQLAIYMSLETYSAVRGTPAIDMIGVHREATHVRRELEDDLRRQVARRPWDPNHPDARSTDRV